MAASAEFAAPLTPSTPTTRLPMLRVLLPPLAKKGKLRRGKNTTRRSARVATHEIVCSAPVVGFADGHVNVGSTNIGNQCSRCVQLRVRVVPIASSF